MPLKWNEQLKKWMGHDQITVETAFKYPGHDASSPKKKEGVTAQHLHEH